jgi:predicted amidophosphoribosyltransferase
VRAGAAQALRRCPIVLTDDLVTTGATLAEAARALRAAGGCVLAAATVAATERRIEDGSTGSPQP